MRGVKLVKYNNDLDYVHTFVVDVLYDEDKGYECRIKCKVRIDNNGVKFIDFKRLPNKWRGKQKDMFIDDFNNAMNKIHNFITATTTKWVLGYER